MPEFVAYLQSLWQWLSSQAWTILIVFFGLLVTSATLYSGSVMSNVIAGLGIRTSRFYRRGDFVTLLDGVSGQVARVGLTHTRILDRVKRDLVLVANADIVAGEIVNHSSYIGHPVTITVPIFDYGDGDRAKAILIIYQVARRFPSRMSGDKFMPLTWMDSVGGNAEYLKARIFIPESEIHEVEFIAGGLLLQMCTALEEAGYGVGEVGEVGFATTELKVSSDQTEESQNSVRLPAEDQPRRWSYGDSGDSRDDYGIGHGSGGR